MIHGALLRLIESIGLSEEYLIEYLAMMNIDEF